MPWRTFLTPTAAGEGMRELLFVELLGGHVPGPGEALAGALLARMCRPKARLRREGGSTGMRRRTQAAWRAATIGALGVFLASSGALAASSTDYPGPCSGEVTVPGTPQYLSSDYHGLSTDFRVIFMPDVGRFRLGISCVATGFVIVRVGPDSALCTVRGRCTEAQLMGLTEADIEAVRFIPNQVPLFHRCAKHGFGWYDAVSVQPGIYLAIASSRSVFWGLIDGHGTMDTYAFFGNGGQYQPVNCSPPGGGGGGGGGGDDPGGGGGDGDYELAY